MQYRQLGGTSLKVSIIGFGAATLGDEYGKADPAECARAVHFAIDSGINFFDVAPYYGRKLAEKRLGEALRGRRRQVVVATKCARYDVNGFDFSAGGVTRMAEQSLEHLQTDYLDVLHVHDVEFGSKRQIVDETLPALERLREKGKVRYIGITGLALRMLRDIAVEYPVDCMLAYCRYNLLNTDLDDVLTPFARERGIGLINASPLHMRLLSDNDPPPWHPAPGVVKDAARRVVELCHRRQVSPPEVALSFALQHPYISSTFVGISSVAEVKEDLKALGREPDPELLAEIEKITRPIKKMMWITGKAENH
jgi:L-galactose dehydrogenase